MPPELDSYEAFWVGTRLAYIALVGASVFYVLRGRGQRYAPVLFGALLLLGWLASNYGLSRIYGLQVPGDRARNLSWCMSAAAGNSPLGTGVIGQTSLEPFWAGLVAALSLWSPDRALVMYPFLSLAGLASIALSLCLHFRRFDASGKYDARSPANEMLGLSVAAFAILLATSSIDYLGPFRGYWAKMFLLKPNHTIGFILIPVVVGAMSRASGRKLVTSGLLLGVLSVAFVVHWVFFCFCMAAYVALTALTRRPHTGDELRRVSVMILVSCIFVAPGLYMIAKYFPHALTLAAGSYPEAPMRSDWGDTIPVGVSLLFLVTLEQGLVFYMAVCGLYFWLKERTRASLTWASLLIGAYVLWGMNCVLYWTSRAREADEFYFFLIFVQAIAAGYGAYRVASTLGRRLFDSAPSRRRALAGLLVVLAPLGFPYWWHPMVMDSHYRVATRPVWPPIVAVTDWVRQETDGGDIFLAAGEMMQWIPALSGRRSLPFSESLREPLERLIDGEKVPSVNADYIVWSEELETVLGNVQAKLVRSGCCSLVHDAHAIRVYRIAP